MKEFIFKGFKATAWSDDVVTYRGECLKMSIADLLFPGIYAASLEA